MDDFVLSDKEYQALASALVTFGEVTEERIAEYVRILTFICDSIITEGSTAQNLRTFLEHAATMTGAVTELTSSIQTSIDGFIASVDEADEYLYN